MANLMSQRAYSRHRGCALRAVQKAIEAGRITLVTGPDGKQYVDQVQADRDWDRNTDQAKQTLMHASTGATPAPPSATAPPRVAASDGGPDDDDAPEPEGQSDAYRKARAQREEIRRDRELLELEKLRGNLIALDEVRALAFTAFRTLRDSLLNVPARIKDERPRRWTRCWSSSSSSEKSRQCCPASTWPRSPATRTKTMMKTKHDAPAQVPERHPRCRPP